MLADPELAKVLGLSQHTHEEFASFFAGTDIMPPGIVEARRWVAGVTAPPPETGLYVRCGAGVKT